jgi:hypothetical protein
MTGRITVPALFEHVSVNVVTAEMLTLVAWPLVTAPTPLSIVHAGSGYGSFSKVQFHVTSVGSPAVTEFGVATNDVSGGCDGAGAALSGRGGKFASTSVADPSSLHATRPHATIIQTSLLEDIDSPFQRECQNTG